MTDIEVLKRGVATVRQYRQQHGFRAPTLVPDLALMGLVDDLTDAAETALELLGSTRPYRAYLMARVAFEAAQRLLVLATTSDYMQIGTRAWVYYQEKDSEFQPASSLSGPRQAAEQIVDVWERYCPDARARIDEQRAFLQKSRRPDNFLRRNLAEATEEAYRVLAEWRGRKAPKTVATDADVYKVLSRESHACVRLTPRGFRIDGDGFVEVLEAAREPEAVAGPVTDSLYTSLREVTSALEYRLDLLRITHAQHLAGSVQSGKDIPLPADFVPDLGLELLEQGFGSGQITFPGVPVSRLGRLTGGGLSFSLRTTSDPATARTATFDFKGDFRRELIQRIVAAFPEMGKTLEDSKMPNRLNLPEPLMLNLTAVLGDMQQNENERFVPLIVVKIDT